MDRFSTALFPVEQVTVPPNRQRKEIKNIQDLVDSISRIGLINPIVIKKDGTLIAGERRLSAWKQLMEASRVLGNDLHDSIPVRFLEDLSDTEARVIELDENTRREDISWQERAAAVREIHSILSSSNEEWTVKKTADHIGYTLGHVSKFLALTAEQNERVQKAPTIQAALRAVKRERDRKVADVVTELETGVFENSNVEKPETGLFAIKQADAISFMRDYQGPKFNIIHCDFPYGINFQKGWNGSTEHWGGYQDSPDIYWALLNALADSWENIAAPSAHLVFWFSMHHYSATMNFFAKRLPQVKLDPFPFIWHKSDNRGSLPDPYRGMRRVYETALFGRTQDRTTVQAVSNVFTHPAARVSAIHVSEKPVEVLSHLFRMLIDTNSTVFDPTCGSGTAIIAARKLGAARGLGLELDEGYATAAQNALVAE